MLMPALDLTKMIGAQNFDNLDVPLNLGTDVYIGPTRAIPQPGAGVVGTRFLVPVNTLFIDSGTAFSPMRFMGQLSEIRHTRVLLQLRSIDYKNGRKRMIAVMDFLLGKKVYVYPGDPPDPDDPNPPDTRVAWHTLDVDDVPDPTPPLDDPNRMLRRFISSDEDVDPPVLEYLDVYTTSSEPIHSGPNPSNHHFFTTTYNMVYIQEAEKDEDEEDEDEPMP